MKNICFVCGYDELQEQFYVNGRFTATFEICPCCGFQYGYHDLNGTGEYPDNFKEKDILNAYRKKWIDGGMRWWAEEHGELDERKPDSWSPREQIKNIPQEFFWEG